MKRITPAAPLLAATLAAGVLALPAPSMAQTTFAFQGIYAGNNENFVGDPFNGGPTNAANPFTGSKSWTGLASDGATQQTMTVSGSAFSYADYGQAHVAASATVTNPYYNPANAPYFDGATVNEDGSPDLIALHGNAGWTDTFTYTGTQLSGYRVNYYFLLTGSASGDVEAGLNFHASDSPDYESFRTSGGSALWITEWHDVVWDVPFDISVDFFGGMTTHVSQRPEGQTIAGSGDWSHTLTLAGINMVDPNGNPYDGWALTTASGTQYPRLAAVPEPGAAALLLGIALPALGRLARLRRE